MRKIKNSEYYRANELEKRFWSIGIPSRYWKDETFSFSTMVKEIKSAKTKKPPVIITEEKQKEIFKQFTEGNNPEPLQHPYLILIGSVPTDELAVSAGFDIIKHAIGLAVKEVHRFKITSIDLGNFSIKDHPEDDTPNIIMIYNISSKATQDRIQLARDVIYEFNNSFKILSLGGSDPVDFYQDHLMIKPDVCLYFKNKILHSKTRIV